MEISIISEQYGIAEIEKEGRRYTGIFISRAKHTRELSSLVDLKKEHGWILHHDRFEPWTISGTAEIEGKVYFYGPYVEGKLLAHLLKDQSENRIRYISRLATVLERMRSASLPVDRLHTNGIIFSEQGKVFVFPPKIMESIKRLQGETTNLQVYGYYNHPLLEGERNNSFSLGVLSYLATTEDYPYSGETEIEVHEKMREFNVVPPHLKKIGIKEQVSLFIMRSLRDSYGTPPDLCEWVEASAEWADQGIHEEISESLKATREEEGAKIGTSSTRSFNRKVFLHRNRGKIMISAIALAAAVWIISSIVSSALEPPVTLGMGPREVVELFYTSVNRFDSETLEQCLGRGVKAAEVREVLNLYVLSRVRMAYEGTSGIMPAQEWLDQGRPELPEGTSVYGIANLTIKKINETTFTASYEKWVPQNSEQDPNTETTPIISGTQNVDRLILENKGTHWVISAIERVKEKPII